MNDRMHTLSLVCFKQADELWRQPIPEGTSFIGRGEECEFRIADERLSRKHFQVKRSGDVVYIENISSFGEMIVNGEAREHVELKVNDKVVFADFEIRMRELPVEQAEAPQVAGPERPIEVATSGGAQSFNVEGSLATDLAQKPVFDESQPGMRFPEQDRDGRTQVQTAVAVGKLVVISGPDSGKEFELSKNEIIMGRSPTADVVLSDESLSRKHCKIVKTGSSYRIVDLESSNGTRVNGVRVIEQLLKSFDVVNIGATEFRFLMIHKEWGDDLPANVQPSEAMIRRDGLEPLDPAVFAQAGMVEEVPPAPAVPVEEPQGWRRVVSTVRTWWQTRTKPQRLMYFTLATVVILLLLSSLSPERKAAEVKKEAAPTPTPNKSIPDAFYALSADEKLEIEKHYNNAFTAYQQGNWIEVVKEANVIKTKLPFYKDLDTLLTESQQNLARIDQENYDKIPEEEAAEKPGDIYFYLEEGDTYLKQGDFEKARANYQKAIELDPANEDAKRGMRAAEAQQRDKDWEIKEEQRKSAADQNVAEVVKRGSMQVEAEQFEEGVATLQSALKMSVYNQDIHMAAQKWIETAITRRREKYKPDLIDAGNLISQKKYVDAYNLCESVLSKVPDYVEAKKCMEVATESIQFESRRVYRQALVDEYLGNHAAAKESFRQILKSFPPSDLYYQRSLKRLKRYDPED
jgi:pSer/pThr/pTyr-binding forkhead associated (FHA) protein/tetratricopeptide (TPR) repeat protein